MVDIGAVELAAIECLGDTILASSLSEALVSQRSPACGGPKWQSFI